MSALSIGVLEALSQPCIGQPINGTAYRFIYDFQTKCWHYHNPEAIPYSEWLRLAPLCKPFPTEINSHYAPPTGTGCGWEYSAEPASSERLTQVCRQILLREIAKFQTPDESKSIAELRKLLNKLQRRRVKKETVQSVREWWEIPRQIEDDNRPRISWDEYRQTVPQFPQKPPKPFKNAEFYRWGEAHTLLPWEWNPTWKLPTSQAKTDLGQIKARQAFKQACAERKLEFDVWNKFMTSLPDAPSRGYDSVDGVADPREKCPYCGGGIFNSRMVCRDCKQRYFTAYEKPDSQTESASEENYVGFHDVEAKQNQVKQHLTPLEFLAGLELQWHGFEKMTRKLQRPLDLQKAKGSFRILCDGWMTRDVKQIYFSETSEKTDAIERRAERLYDIVKKAGKLPEITAEGLQELKNILSE